MEPDRLRLFRRLPLRAMRVYFPPPVPVFDLPALAKGPETWWSIALAVTASVNALVEVWRPTADNCAPTTR